MTHHVVYCFDENYEAHFGASVTSLILNYKEPGESLCIHVITECASIGFIEKINFLKVIFRCRIEVINPTEKSIDLLSSLTVSVNHIDYISRATYLRILIPILLSEDVDRVLYLDADTIVCESISVLLDSAPVGNPVYGVSDFSEGAMMAHHGIDQYINTGVMVLDLQCFRKENHVDKLLGVARENTGVLKYSDQCVINIYFNNDINKIDDRWNQFILHDKKSKIMLGGIFHFITKNKPWHSWYDNSHGDIYWHYRRVSPWHQGEPEAPKTVEQYKYQARKFYKNGQHQRAQGIYEEILKELVSHIDQKR